MSTRQPLPSTREDGVSRGHNSKATRGNASGEVSVSWKRANTVADGLVIEIAEGRRT